MLTLDNLIGYQLAEYARASKLRVWLIVVQFTLALPAAASVVVDDGKVLYGLAIAGLVLLIVWLWIANSYSKHREAAERARRAVLVMGGLGKQLSPPILLEICRTFQVTEQEAAIHRRPDYFASDEPPGNQRLAEMVEESAFWTADLHATSAWILVVALAALAAIGIAILFTAIPFTSRTNLMAATRMFLTFLVFVLSSDVLGSLKGHLTAARAVAALKVNMAEARARQFPTGDVVLAMSEYNAAVEGAPVMLPFVYRVRRKRLDREWNTYLKAKIATENQERHQ